MKTGRRGLPPGVYFRMLFIGYFEDISSQRGIAWRCEDSRSLSRFLGYAPGQATPDHSTLSPTRARLPMEVHNLAFELILSAAQEHGLLNGKTIGIDATDLEANASTHTWTGKPPRMQEAYRRNCRNTKGRRGRRLQRLRSERVERTFAHLCDTGGSRRTWLRGLEKVRKRYFLSAAMGYNLGRIMRSLLGAGKPRYFGVLAERSSLASSIIRRLLIAYLVFIRPQPPQIATPPAPRFAPT